MPDERLDSIRKGIHAPPESPIGTEAEREREAEIPFQPRIGGAMGGTSDAESAGQEADRDAKRAASEEGREG